MLLYSGSSNKTLAEKIAKDSTISLGNIEKTVFPDGETRIRVVDDVLEKDASILQSGAKFPEYYYFELFFLLDALKRRGAKNLTAIVPYLGYQRQDHLFREGEAVSLDVIIQTLESLSLSKLITFDLHSIKIPELFHVPVVHLSALSIFAEKIKSLGVKNSDLVIVSPDMGGIRRINILSDLLGGVETAKINKDRDLESGEISSAKIEGAVKEAAIIVDDMISTGRTIIAAANLLKKKGAKKIFVFATHPVFSFDDPKVFDDNSIQKVFVSDTIEIEERSKFPKLEILSVASLIAEEIKK